MALEAQSAVLRTRRGYSTSPVHPLKIVGNLGDSLVSIECIQLNTATADSWSRLDGVMLQAPSEV